MLPDLTMSTLANNGSFGVECLLQGHPIEKFKPLIEQGIQYCTEVVDTEPEARNIRQKLTDILMLDMRLTEEETRQVQHFFNSSSDKFLATAMRTMKNREKRTGCFK
jgi:hypothetical protein